ncbi:unnamed protein product [Lampetra planeri]
MPAAKNEHVDQRTDPAGAAPADVVSRHFVEGAVEEPTFSRLLQLLFDAGQHVERNAEEHARCDPKHTRIEDLWTPDPGFPRAAMATAGCHVVDHSSRVMSGPCPMVVCAEP